MKGKLGIFRGLVLWGLVIYLLFFVRVGSGLKFTGYEASEYYAHRVVISVKSKILARNMYKTIKKYQKLKGIN